LMSRVYAATWMLVLVLETGCPVGSEAGVLRQAMLRDIAEGLSHEGCQPADIQDECGDKYYDACMADCRKAMQMRTRK
jgi:hypothetical protein